jgi:hypothetical protein
MFPAAAIPVIMRSGDLLETATAAAWQWRRGGVPIAGANARTFPLTEPGVYTVRITDANGCSAVSDPYIVNVLGIENTAASDFSIQVYPNPGSGVFHFLLDVAVDVEAAVTVTDMLGRVLLQRTITSAAGNSHELDLRGKSAGVYILTVQTRQRTLRRTLLLD